jgi:D-ribose pyranose/furanose isomerase RbsD
VLVAGDDYTGTDTHNPLYVDANGFLTTDFIQSQHQDINFGFDTMASNMTTDGAGAAWSKTNPISTTDDGWYLEGTGLSTLLWYNNGNYQSTVFPIQSNFTFADIDIWFMILKNYFPFNTTTQIMPEIYIYSKPTGTGDFIAGLCHSVWYYTCNSGQSINYGESIMIYTGQTARIKKNNPELRRIPYTNTGGGGDRANTEVINHIEFRFNTANTYKILVQEGGVYVKNKGLLNYYFTTDNATNADIATIAMNTTTSSINTKLTGMTYTSNRLQTQATLVDAGGDVATISAPTVLTGTTTIRGLDSQSYVNAYNILTNVYDNLTATLSSPATPSGSYNALDTYVRNPKTQVVNYGQTTVDGLSGLNIYQIYPKKIHYTLSGRTESGAANVIMGGTGSSKLIYDVAFGKASPQAFSAVLTGGSINRIINYHYVNTEGVLKTDGTALLTALNTPVTLSPATMISINKHWMVGTVGASDQVVIRFGTTNTAANTICHSDVDDYNNGVITVPNGYIGYLTNIGQYSPTGCFFSVVKWDVDSWRSVTYPFYNASQQSFTSGHNGSLGGIYTAGESIAFSRVTAMGASIAVGMFVLEPI